MEPKWDSEKGTVTLVNGEETKTFDLSKEEDRLNFMKLGQRGIKFDSQTEELGELRKQAEILHNWDSAFEAAKTSPEAMEQFIDKLEQGLGRPLTRKEEKEVRDEDSEFVDPAIKSLKQEIADLKKQQELKSKADEDEKLKAEAEKLDREADALEKKYPGSEDGRKPAFQRKEIFKFAAENGIFDLELAFKMKYLDKLTETAKQDALEEYKKQLKSRKDAFVEDGEGTSASDLKIQAPKAKSHYQLKDQMMETARKKGLSLFEN